MKVILYMAVTANGLIAKEDDDVSFISKDEWNSYGKAVKKAGNMVIGKRTYEIMKKTHELLGFPDVKIIVLSKSKFPKPSEKEANVIFTAKSPKEVIKFLEEQRFDEALIAGGGILNASFMKAGVVDEVILDVEPVFFGKGIKLFRDETFEARLELIGTKKLSADELQLHYRVKK